jgi:hypothetical protein
MGASASGPITHEKLFSDTGETRGIMNLLLEYMLKNITVRDFLALSNPTECKKYVLFLANQMNQQFYELKITPQKGKKDSIAFRSIKDLATPDDRTDKEKQSLCLSIAYFYTRIFQIYGALALTLMDDINVTQHYETGIFFRKAADYSDGLGTPGSSQVYLRGGADLPSSVSLDFYEFMRPYLREERIEPYGYSVRYTVDSKTNIYFSREPGYLDERQQPVPVGVSVVNKYQKGQFAIAYPESTNYAYLIMIATKSPPTSLNIRLQFNSLQYSKKGTAQYTILNNIPSQYLPHPTINIVGERSPNDQEKTVYTIKEAKNVSVTDYFNSLFSRLVPYIKQLTETDGPVIPGALTPKNLLTPGFKSEDNIDPTFHIGRTIQNLQIHKPLGHCIARALQLLKNLPLGDEPAYSSICKATFLEIQKRTQEGTVTTSSRSGIPLPGDGLDKSPGLTALSQLFFDTIAIGSPRLQINTVKSGKEQSSLDEYRVFMLKMARLFGDRGERSLEVMEKTGLSGIRNKRDAALCQAPTGIPGKTKEITEAIPVDKPIAKKVYGIVTSMFKRQMEHSENCGKIFKMLFYIKKEKDSNYYTVRLNDNVIRGGIPEVDRINRLARKVLVEYYSNCESQYMLGMKEVLEHYHDKQVKAAEAKAAEAKATEAKKLANTAAVAQMGMPSANPVLMSSAPKPNPTVLPSLKPSTPTLQPSNPKTMKRRRTNKNATAAQTLKKQVTIAAPPVTSTTIPTIQPAQTAQVAQVAQVAQSAQTTPKLI